MGQKEQVVYRFSRVREKFKADHMYALGPIRKKIHSLFWFLLTSVYKFNKPNVGTSISYLLEVLTWHWYFPDITHFHNVIHYNTLAVNTPRRVDAATPILAVPGYTLVPGGQPSPRYSARQSQQSDREQVQQNPEASVFSLQKFVFVWLGIGKWYCKWRGGGLHIS